MHRLRRDRFNHYEANGVKIALVARNKEENQYKNKDNNHYDNEGSVRLICHIPALKHIPARYKSGILLTYG
jgi:hypothetical protein